MNLYVETNFLLEIAFRQEEERPAIDLLEACERGTVGLVVPDFSIAEAVINLVRRRNERRDLQQRLTTELSELSRSVVFREEARPLQGASGFLARAQSEQQASLGETTRRTLTVAEVIGLDRAVWDRSTAYRDLSPQDALVIASVTVHLERNPQTAGIFVTRNSRDFGSEEIVTELDRLGCKTVFHFRDALRLVQRASR